MAINKMTDINSTTDSYGVILAATIIFWLVIFPIWFYLLICLYSLWKELAVGEATAEEATAEEATAEEATLQEKVA
jgi:hypothetical protein